jgi:hypothetical protein
MTIVNFFIFIFSLFLSIIFSHGLVVEKGGHDIFGNMSKVRHILCNMQYLVMAFMWSNYINWKEVYFVVPIGQRKKLWQELFLDLFQWSWYHKWRKATKHQTYPSSHVNEVVFIGVNLVASFGCHPTLV